MFAILFEKRRQAEQAREVLAGESFGVDLQDQADGSIVLVATPKTAAVSFDALAARIQHLADRFGGESLGHGGLTSFGLGGHS
jgi:hypothetical protein